MATVLHTCMYTQGGTAIHVLASCSVGENFVKIIILIQKYQKLFFIRILANITKIEV